MIHLLRFCAVYLIAAAGCCIWLAAEWSYWRAEAGRVVGRAWEWLTKRGH
jgi:hypothetical protein